MNSIFRVLEEAKITADTVVEFEGVRREALELLEEYIYNDRSWHRGNKDRQFIEKVKFMRGRGGKFLKDVKETSEIAKVSGAIENKLGVCVINTIMNGRLSEVQLVIDHLQMFLLHIHKDMIIPEFILNRYQEGFSISSYNLEECKKELNFLGKYSINEMKNQFRELDIEKMWYLLNILDDDRKFKAREKISIYRYITNTVDENIGMEDELNGYNVCNNQ